MKNHPFLIDVLGTRISIETDQAPEYFQELVSRVRERSERIRGSLSLNDPLKLAVLTSIFLEDELAKCRSGYPSDDSDEVERLRLSMIKCIDETLGI